MIKTVWRYQPLHGLNFLWMIIQDAPPELSELGLAYWEENDSGDYRWITPRANRAGNALVWPPPEWVLGYTAWFPTQWYLKLLLWIFVIVPITIATIYVYQPPVAFKYEKICWDKFVGMFRRKSNSASELGRRLSESSTQKEKSE